MRLLERQPYKTLIIAEAGVNHNGCLSLAKRLIDVAADAAVDYIKFQTFIAERNIATHAKKAAYQIKNTNKAEESQLEMVKKLELSVGDHQELYQYAASRNVRFISTAFDFESINILAKFKLDFFKIPSGEIVNLPYLRRVAELDLPIVMSTGMANLDEVREALEVLLERGIDKEDIAILHCNTEYPTPMM